MISACLFPTYVFPAYVCPACGAAGALWLFFLILGVFILMFGGTILLFIAGVGRGEWHDHDLRWSAVDAEKPARERERAGNRAEESQQ